MADDALRNLAIQSLTGDFNVQNSSSKQNPSYTLYKKELEDTNNLKETKKELQEDNLAQALRTNWKHWSTRIVNEIKSGKNYKTVYEDIASEIYEILRLPNIHNRKDLLAQSKQLSIKEEQIDLPDLSSALNEVLTKRTEKCVEDIDATRAKFTRNIDEDIIKGFF